MIQKEYSGKGGTAMVVSDSFGKWLRERRTELGMTQQQLAGKMFVSIALVSYWENGHRTPDVAMLSRLAACLEVPDAELLAAMQENDAPPTVILVDDEKIILNGGLATLHEALPDAQIAGFLTAAETLRFARENQVDVAFLDIELRSGSGLTLAKKLREINPKVNIIFLTSYREYALDAWELDSSGYLLKPLTVEHVLHEMSVLRFPVRGMRT